MLPELPQLTTTIEDTITKFMSSIAPYKLDVKGKVNYYILPPELNFLATLDDDPIKPIPEGFTILAAFDEKGLAGRTMLVSCPHIEGTWVREDLRNGRVGYVLMREVEKSIAAAGRSNAIAFSPTDSPDVDDKLARLGYEKLPVNVWVKYDLKEK